MTDQRAPAYFVEKINNVSHSNGMFRITFAEQEAENIVKDKVCVLIPENQLQNVIQGIANAANEIRNKTETAEKTTDDDDPEIAASTLSKKEPASEPSGIPAEPKTKSAPAVAGKEPVPENIGEAETKPSDVPVEPKVEPTPAKKEEGGAVRGLAKGLKKLFGS